MPKKFQGENSKAVVARARKAEKAAAEKASKEKAAEDAYWKEDDKLICKKIQRKEEKERKRQEDAQRRQEKKTLEESEMREIESKFIVPPQKVTLFQLEKQREERAKLASTEQVDTSHTDVPLVENLNRLESETITASGIDAAVAALSVDESKVDKHPERRMAAAYRAFEAERLPQLKKENPTMRFTQLKQLLRKEWQKSFKNPLNQSIST